MRTSKEPQRLVRERMAHPVSGKPRFSDHESVSSLHGFSAIFGDRRGSDREDPPPDPRWWRVLAADPRCGRVVEFLDRRYADGFNFAVVHPEQIGGPWRLYVYRDEACEWEWGDRDLGLLDYHRDRLLALWPGAEPLEGEPSESGAHGGWLVP